MSAEERRALSMTTILELRLYTLSKSDKNYRVYISKPLFLCCSVIEESTFDKCIDAYI